MDNVPADRIAAYQHAQQQAGQLVQSYPAEGEEYWSSVARHLLTVMIYTNGSGMTPAADLDLRAILGRLSDDAHVSAILAGEAAPFLSGECDWYLNADPRNRATILAHTRVILLWHLKEQEQDDLPL